LDDSLKKNYLFDMQLFSTRYLKFLIVVVMAIYKVNFYKIQQYPNEYTSAVDSEVQTLI